MMLRRSPVVAVGLAVLLTCACSADTDAGGPAVGPTSTDASTGGDGSVPELLAEYLPPVPAPETARAHSADCGPLPEAMSGHDHHAPDPEPDERRAQDGSYERRYEGMNPRIEVSAVPFDQAPTEQQRQDATTFVDEVRSVVAERGWVDPSRAVRDGYRPFALCNTHYVNPQYLLDDAVLDPSRPEFVMIEPDADGINHLTGVMFVASTPDGHGPQRFGPLAPWHYHADPMCGVGVMMLVSVDPEDCPDGTVRQPRSPEMLHVTAEGPNPFDSSMMSM